MATKDEIDHILLHVEAEAATSTPIQVPGVAGRAQQARDLLDPHKNDNQARDRGEILGLLIASAVTGRLKSVLQDLDPNNGGQPIREFVQRWVRTGLLPTEDEEG